MDRKVWAIVGIIAVHLSLMMFFRGTLKPEELAQSTKSSHPDVSPIEPNPYLVPTFPTSDNAADEAAPAEPIIARAVKKLQRIETASRSRKTPARNAAPGRIRNFETVQVQTAAVRPPVFQDTVIYVKASEVRPIYLADKKFVAEPKAVPAARIAPIKKKKPFLKRAVVPIIRKPYDWIKTLVSKL